LLLSSSLQYLGIKTSDDDDGDEEEEEEEDSKGAMEYSIVLE
jgi:hypothetical protein